MLGAREALLVSRVFGQGTPFSVKLWAAKMSNYMSIYFKLFIKLKEYTTILTRSIKFIT